MRAMEHHVIGSNKGASACGRISSLVLRRHMNRAPLAFRLRRLRRRNNVTAGMRARDICMRAAALDRACVSTLHGR
jgi:hypothetical protein